MAPHPPPTPRGPFRAALPALFLGLAAAALPFAFATPGGAGGAPDDRAGTPTRIRPQRERGDSPVALPRGEHLLIPVLQRFANRTGETVYVTPGIPPGATMQLDARTEDLDAKTLTPALASSGFALGREEWQGRQVWWVRRRLEPPKGRKRGAIVRREAPAEEDEGTEDAGSPAASGAAAGSHVAREASGRLERIGPDTCIFERVDEGGRGFLVTFETRSAAEAEHVARTIALILRDRRRGDATTGPRAEPEPGRTGRDARPSGGEPRRDR